MALRCLGQAHSGQCWREAIRSGDHRGGRPCRGRGHLGDLGVRTGRQQRVISSDGDLASVLRLGNSKLCVKYGKEERGEQAVTGRIATSANDHGIGTMGRGERWMVKNGSTHQGNGRGRSRSAPSSPSSCRRATEQARGRMNTNPSRLEYRSRSVGWRGPSPGARLGACLVPLRSVDWSSGNAVFSLACGRFDDAVWRHVCG